MVKHNRGVVDLLFKSEVITMDRTYDEREIAPGLNTEDELDEEATEEEVEEGDSTSVTRLYIDRTPRD
ncbi:MAG: hypothetical protein H7X86_13085 [Gorillibacterium sp.]|nr:hypothetical protein [Gorillibacterium sp.]